MATPSGDLMVAIKEQLFRRSGALVTFWTQMDSSRPDVVLNF